MSKNIPREIGSYVGDNFENSREVTAGVQEFLDAGIPPNVILDSLRHVVAHYEADFSRILLLGAQLMINTTTKEEEREIRKTRSGGSRLSTY